MGVDKNIKDGQIKDQYVAGLQIDKKLASQVQKSYAENKTRQQSYLEDLIQNDNFEFKELADVACGGGAPRLLAE